MEISAIQERYFSQVYIPIRIKSNSSSTVCLCSSHDTLLFSIHNLENISAADAGFPVGERRPAMRALFGKNVCENKRIGSHWGGCTPAAPP